jgi:hypothetical protein
VLLIKWFTQLEKVVVLLVVLLVIMLVIIVIKIMTWFLHLLHP